MPNTDQNQYPFGPLPVRRVVLRGKYHPRPKNAPQVKQEGGEVPVLRTPPIQTSEERGAGDSVNARVHRLLTGKE